MIVRLLRTLEQGMVGRDVSALQRALIVAKVRSMPPTGAFGIGTRKQVQRFQALHDLEADGVYGPATHARLAPFFDAYGAWLMEHPSIGRDKRQAVVAAALFCVNHEPEIHYTQDLYARWEGIRERLRPPRFPTHADCSSLVSWYYWLVGMDINGSGYQYGSTYTQTNQGRQVANPQPADLVFYHTPDHVACFVGSGLVVSHGSESGPDIVPWRYRTVWQVRSYLSP